MDNSIKPCLYCGQSKMHIEEKPIYEKISNFQVKCTSCGAMGPKGKNIRLAIYLHNGAHIED